MAALLYDTVPIKKLHTDAIIPKPAKAGDAGFDLSAIQDVEVPPGKVTVVPTGLAWAIPSGHFGHILQRSGMGKKGIMVQGGVIDSNYRGDVGVMLLHFNNEPYHIKKGDRIAQLVFQKIYVPKLQIVEELDQTERGTDGFGSTGN